MSDLKMCVECFGVRDPSVPDVARCSCAGGEVAINPEVVAKQLTSVVAANGATLRNIVALARFVTFEELRSHWPVNSMPKCEKLRGLLEVPIMERGEKWQRALETLFMMIDNGYSPRIDGPNVARAVLDTHELPLKNANALADAVMVSKPK